MENKQMKIILMTHIEKYKESPLIEKILNGESTFLQEVDNFYGLAVGTGLDKFYSIKKFESSKKGQTPGLLINVLSPLSECNLDSNLLSYELVRENYSKYSKRFWSLTGTSFFIFAGGFAGLGVSPYFAIPTTIGFISLSLLGISRPDTNSSLGNFESLDNASLKADNLIEEFYGKE